MRVMSTNSTTLAGPDQQPLIEYTYTATPPKEVPAKEALGNIFVTQLISRYAECYYLGQAGHVIASTVDPAKPKKGPQFWLDSTAYYPAANGGAAYVPIGNSYNTRDTPTLRLLNVGKDAIYSDAVTLRTYFMYQPNGGVPVALNYMETSYSGVAYNDSPGGAPIFKMRKYEAPYWRTWTITTPTLPLFDQVLTNQTRPYTCPKRA